MKLNFNEVKRPSLDIVLNDDNQTQLTVQVPKNADAKKFLDMFQNIKNRDNSDKTLNELYTMCATLLSYNKEEISITAEYIMGFFGIDDLIIFFSTYQEFLLGIYNTKN